MKLAPATSREARDSDDAQRDRRNGGWEYGIGRADHAVGFAMRVSRKRPRGACRFG
jgi:hypothetical protein